jgi:hypothetical protein
MEGNASRIICLGCHLALKQKNIEITFSLEHHKINAHLSERELRGIGAVGKSQQMARF